MTEPPPTYCVDPQTACDQLDHADMVALSGAFRRWALDDSDVAPERRTELIKYSADYERLAEWVGSQWRARIRAVKPPLMKFLATLEREPQEDVDLNVQINGLESDRSVPSPK